MTTKQIAQAVGKAERTVHGWVSEASAKSAEISAKIAQARATSKPADYTIDETCSIIETGMGANAAGIFRANAQNSQKRNASDSKQVRLVFRGDHEHSDQNR